MSPACPHGLHFRPRGNVQYQLDIGVVVVVCPARHRHVLIGQPDILCSQSQMVWYQFVWNNDVRRLTKQPKLTAIIQSHWLTLFGHIMCMDDNADTKRILLVLHPADRRRQPGRPRITWLSTFHRIWNATTLRSPKQQIWLRTALCGGRCWPMALRNLRVACQKRRRRISANV